MSECQCGKRASKHFDNRYCSYYCKMFVERGLKMVNSKYPPIKLTCQTCGDNFNYPKNKNHMIYFCSPECKTTLAKVNVPKPRMNYFALLYLQEKEDWISAKDLDKYMETKSYRSHANRWAGILKRWAKAGIVDRTLEKPYQYRFNQQYIKQPIAKLMISIRGLKNEL